MEEDISKIDEKIIELQQEKQRMIKEQAKDEKSTKDTQKIMDKLVKILNEKGVNFECIENDIEYLQTRLLRIFYNEYSNTDKAYIKYQIKECLEENVTSIEDDITRLNKNKKILINGIQKLKEDIN